MVDVVLLAGRLLLLALLYLFLLAAIRAGIGLIAGQAPPSKDRGLVLAVSRGPSELLGTRVPLRGPVIIGRSPGPTSSSPTSSSRRGTRGSRRRAPERWSRTSDRRTARCSTARGSWRRPRRRRAT